MIVYVEVLVGLADLTTWCCSVPEGKLAVFVCSEQLLATFQVESSSSSLPNIYHADIIFLFMTCDFCQLIYYMSFTCHHFCLKDIFTPVLKDDVPIKKPI